MAGLLVVAIGAAACDRNGEPDPESGAEPIEQSIGDEADEPGDSIYDVDAEVIEPDDVGPEAPAVYFVSGLKGYTEPCGCTADVLLGGIDRITAYVRDARGLHPDAVFVDAGDWLFESEDIPDHLYPQERAKAEVLADAYRRMNAILSVPGNRDLALGVEFYESKMQRAGMQPVGANVTLDGDPLDAAAVAEVDGEVIRFVGAGDPQLYDGIDGVEVGDDRRAVAEAVEGADEEAVVLVYQGERRRAEALAEEVPGVDFVIVGHDPERVDDPVPAGSAHLLQSYDQGRYVGRLKLYGLDATGEFIDPRGGARDERELIDTQIEGVRNDLRRLEVRAGGERPPMMDRLEQRLEGLEQRREQWFRDAFELPDEARAFLFRPIAMEPGYRLDDEIRSRRREFNKSLEELNADIDREPIPHRDGEPFFVGQSQCQACHGEAYDFWEQTSHASAVETLEVRHKAHDQNCIGCHVDGWEEPGGSVAGKLTYEADLGGRAVEKELADVGCESCHGPGSKHVLQPLDSTGQPQHIVERPRESQCVDCHVPDHSPGFDFDVYVEQITGEGHRYSGGR